MSTVHPSMQRLYQVTEARTPPLRGQSAVGRALDKSPQVIKNWEVRGISWEGLVLAQKAFDANAVWLREGIGAKYAVPNADGVSAETALHVLIRAIAALSPAARKALADDLALLAQAPDSAGAKSRVLAALAAASPAMPARAFAETHDFAGGPAVHEDKIPVGQQPERKHE